jgi:hypothetical protein
MRLGESSNSSLQLGNAFVATVGNRTAGCRAGEQALLGLAPLRLGLVFSQSHPRHFGVDVWPHSESRPEIESGTDPLLVTLQFSGHHISNRRQPLPGYDRRH